MFLKDKVWNVIRNKSLHQTSFVTFGSLINGGSLLLLNIILAKILSQESFGIFALSVLALSAMAEVSDFGLNMGLLRFAPYYISSKQDDKLKQLLKTVWRWRVVLVSILTAGGVLFSYPLAKYLLGEADVSPYLMYSFLGIGGVVFLGFLNNFLQSKQNFFYQASLQSIKGLLRLFVVLILALLGVKNLFAYLSVYITVPWILFLSNFHVLPKKFWQVKIDEDIKKQMHSQLAKFSFWITAASLMAIVTGKIDQVMISHYLGLKEVAIFTIAWQFIQVFPIIYGSISSVLMPKISSLDNKEAVLKFTFRVFKWIFVAVLVIACFIYPSQYLIQILFGEKYIEAMPLYLILAFNMLLNILSVPFSMLVTIFNKTHIITASSFFQLIILVICNMFFIPKYGIIGVAYTHTVVLAVNLVWNLGWSIFLIKRRELKVV